jgi:hypothetical protein
MHRTDSLSAAIARQSASHPLLVYLVSSVPTQRHHTCATPTQLLQLLYDDTARDTLYTRKYASRRYKDETV